MFKETPATVHTLLLTNVSMNATFEDIWEIISTFITFFLLILLLGIYIHDNVSILIIDY